MAQSASIVIGLKWLDSQVTQDISLPAYETSGSAGMDVSAAVNEEITIEPGHIEVIPTGFAVAIPAGFEIQVRPRSGLAINHGIAIVNAPGTIDSDYRGEVKIGLINLGSCPYCIRRGDRIAQLVVAPVVRAAFAVIGVLDETDRGSGGFGHTGVR